jgi:hypothetical protein
MDHTTARKRPSSAIFHKYLPYLAHQARYQIFRANMVLKYCSSLHRYIHTEIKFLDISSLGEAYRYAVKIEQKIKQKTRQFRPGNPSQQNPGKGSPNPNNKGHNKDG